MMTYGSRNIWLLTAGVVLVVAFTPPGRFLWGYAFGPLFAGRGDLGRFYNSVDYTPTPITLVAIIERAEQICGTVWCPRSQRKEIEQRFQYPLRRELKLNVPPALVNRLGALNSGLAAAYFIIWASDGMPLKERPEGLPPDADQTAIFAVINRRTKERLAAGDRIVHVDMQTTWKPIDIIALEWMDQLSFARNGAACSVEYVDKLDVVRVTHESTFTWGNSACNRLSGEKRATCEAKRTAACAQFPSHAYGRSFFKAGEGETISYMVRCGGGSTLDAAAAAGARIDPLTGFWRSDAPDATGQLGGGRCTLYSHWGEWRFEALVDRDRPEQWGTIHSHVLKLYERLVAKG